MRSYSLHEARAGFSQLVARALAGEPQRVTRHGKEAVVIVSEAHWASRASHHATLGDLLAAHARRPAPPVVGEERTRGHFPQHRPLGADFD